MHKQLMFPNQEYEEARRFVDLVNNTLFSRREFGSRESKLKIIRKGLGYSVLKYRGNKVIPIDDASTPKLTGTINTHYKSALRKIKKYEESVRSQDNYKKIVELLKSEECLSGWELEDALETTSIALSNASDIELKLLSEDFGVKLGGFYQERVA